MTDALGSGEFTSPFCTGDFTSPFCGGEFTSPFCGGEFTSPFCSGEFTSPFCSGDFTSPSPRDRAPKPGDVKSPLHEPGYRVTYLPVDRDGLLKLADLDAGITDQTVTVHNL